jgi:hypothetical protein
MALVYSTKLDEFLTGHGSMKAALEGGSMELWSGDAPATADAAATGTKLVTITLGSAALTAETRATFTLTLAAGASGSLDTVTVDGYEVMGSSVAFDTDLTTTATAVAAQIQKNVGPILGWTATSSGAIVTVSAPHNSGTAFNGKTVATTQTTLTIQINGTSSTTVGGAGATAGVAAANGLTYDTITAGTLTKTGTWSGTVLATGVVGYFRILGSVADDDSLDSSPFSYIRIQGTCGTSGADYNMATTSLTLSATHTVDTFSLALP